MQFCMLSVYFHCPHFDRRGSRLKDKELAQDTTVTRRERLDSRPDHEAPKPMVYSPVLVVTDRDSTQHGTSPPAPTASPISSCEYPWVTILRALTRQGPCCRAVVTSVQVKTAHACVLPAPIQAAQWPARVPLFAACVPAT